MEIYRIVLLVAVSVAAGCGGNIEKDGTPGTGGANATVGPRNNGQAGRMEQGSSDALVVDAYNRLNPLMCAFDATCDEALLADACPSPPAAAGNLQGQCWVVDSAALVQCEGLLRGLQCEGLWTNFPPVCQTAVRQCECVDGYVAGWDDDGEMGCFLPCETSPQCANGEGCYDGACMPLQQDWCPDDQELASVNGEDARCYQACRDETECEGQEACTSGVCIEETPEMP